MIIWSPGRTLKDVEKDIVLEAYRFYERNKTATARSLGICIRTLDARLEEYEVPAPTPAVGNGMELESPQEHAKEQPVSVQKRQEIQKVSPKHDAGRATNKRESGGVAS